MFRKAIFPIIALFVAVSAAISPESVSAAGKKKHVRTMNIVKKEQKAAEKNIKDAGKKLNDNARKTEQNLIKLNQLEGELKEKNREIDNVRSSLTTIDNDIKSAGDSIRLLERNLQLLKQQYASALRKMQGSFRSKNLITFIFSARNFSDASARMRYLKEFSNWRKRKVAEISAASREIGSHREQLGSLQNERQKVLADLSENESKLRDKKNETDRVVAQLKKEGSQLQKTIANNQKKLKNLDSELDRMIVAEQKRQAEAERKAAEAERKKAGEKAKSNKQTKSKATTPKQPEKTAPVLATGNARSRALSGSFENNRGRLLFPVRGKYTIVKGFGRQAHPDLPNVVTDNPGIDIAASDGSKARSIFDGTVSGVFSQDGFNKVVMVRHGSYISIYANLSSITVKTGDKVKANQDLGTIYRDPDHDNRPVLHFELRRERTKLNPLQWVK